MVVSKLGSPSSNRIQIQESVKKSLLNANSWTLPVSGKTFLGGSYM